MAMISLSEASVIGLGGGGGGGIGAVAVSLSIPLGSLETVMRIKLLGAWAVKVS